MQSSHLEEGLALSWCCTIQAHHTRIARELGADLLVGVLARVRVVHRHNLWGDLGWVTREGSNINSHTCIHGVARYLPAAATA